MILAPNPPLIRSILPSPFGVVDLPDGNGIGADVPRDPRRRTGECCRCGTRGCDRQAPLGAVHVDAHGACFVGVDVHPRVGKARDVICVAHTGVVRAAKVRETWRQDGRVDLHVRRRTDRRLVARQIDGDGGDGMKAVVQRVDRAAAGVKEGVRQRVTVTRQPVVAGSANRERGRPDVGDVVGGGRARITRAREVRRLRQRGRDGVDVTVRAGLSADSAPSVVV